MNTSTRKTGLMIPRPKATDRARIASLIDDLQTKDAVASRNARLALVKIGGLAIAPLTNLLRHRDDFVRWEATKTLAEMKSPATACSLIRALEDKTFSVRWLAAEGLIRLRHAALEPLLEELMTHPDHHLLQGSAHQILRQLVQKGEPAELVKPVLDALEGGAPEATVPFAAKQALERLRAEASRQQVAPGV